MSTDTTTTDRLDTIEQMADLGWTLTSPGHGVCWVSPNGDKSETFHTWDEAETAIETLIG